MSFVNSFIPSPDLVLRSTQALIQQTLKVSTQFVINSKSFQQNVYKDVVADPSRAKSRRIENSVLEILRASLREEIPSEIKGLMRESQKELLKLHKPKTGKSMKEENEDTAEDESRNFFPQPGR